jgi:hypothetical protein
MAADFMVQRLMSILRRTLRIDTEQHEARQALGEIIKLPGFTAEKRKQLKSWYKTFKVLIKRHIAETLDMLADVKSTSEGDKIVAALEQQVGKLWAAKVESKKLIREYVDLNRRAHVVAPAVNPKQRSTVKRDRL